MRVVFDANVVVAGVCWQGEGWLCLLKLARRQAFAYGTQATLEETRETAVRVIREQRPKHQAAARLTWYLDRVRRVERRAGQTAKSEMPVTTPILQAALAQGGGYRHMTTFAFLKNHSGFPLFGFARFLKWSSALLQQLFAHAAPDQGGY